MKKLFAVVFIFCALCILFGCAAMCEFGKNDGSSGMKCRGSLAQATVGETSGEVEKAIGAPQSRSVNVSYRGKTYDEVWVYNGTPPTVLYFKHGVLEDKEYQGQ